VARHAQSLVVQDTRNDDRHFDAVQQQADVELRSMICVPLRSQQGMMGVLQVVDTQVGRFSATDLVLLEPLAASVAIAIENARLYAQAQQEIAERTRVEEALRERTVELQERNEELDAFAHTVAHDMKGMLTRLIGFAETLSDDCTVMSGDAIHDYANVIVQSGRQINNIVNELLLLARVRKTEVQIEVIDMAHAVDQALQRLDILIEERQARVIVPPADTWPNVLGYDLWVQEIWVNYLSNAIKYGGAVPCVELGFSECGVGDAAQIQCVFDEAALSGHPSLPADVSMVCFWVRDNGSGLTAQQQLQLFVPFVRLDHARAIGNGLGLSIVQRIVDKLGGGLGVKSEVGKGSTFSFTLPKAAD
jgi:two-component system sensor histidine kinase/response regulator